jgi:polysaccharide export outer membrane protein
LLIKSDKVCKIKEVPFQTISRKFMQTLSFLQKIPVIVAGLVFLVSFGVYAQQAPIAPPVIPQQNDRPSKSDDLPKEHKSAGGAAVDSDTYKVGPADVLAVNVWGEDKFSGKFTVHQDGNITIPLLGDIEAGEKTPVEIEAAIGKQLTKYVVKPRVTVTVDEVLSKKYFLNGMVSHPGEYPLAVPTTILDAISRAGGLQDFANEKRIYILRGDKKLPFNYKEIKNGKHLEQNIKLEPGDHIFVP